jgi:hypothetical protein
MSGLAQPWRLFDKKLSQKSLLMKSGEVVGQISSGIRLFGSWHFVF